MRNILCLLLLLSGVSSPIQAQHTFKMIKCDGCYLIRDGKPKLLLNRSYDLISQDTVLFTKKSANLLRDMDLHKTYNISNLKGMYLIENLARDVETDNRFTRALKIIFAALTSNFIGEKTIGSGAQASKNVSDTLQLAFTICNKMLDFDSTTNDNYSDFKDGSMKVVYLKDQNCYKVENTTSTGLFIDIISFNNKKYSILNPSEKGMTTLFLPANETMMLDITLPEGKCIITGTEIPLPFNALLMHPRETDKYSIPELEDLKVTFQIIKPN